MTLKFTYKQNISEGVTPRESLYKTLGKHFEINRITSKMLFYKILLGAKIHKIETDLNINIREDFKEVQKLINLTYLADLEDFSKETNVNITVNNVRDSVKFDTQSYAINADKLVEIIKDKVDENKR